MFKTRKRKDQRAKLIGILEEKSLKLIQGREEIETRLNSLEDLAEKKELVQKIIDLTHQIQALRIVIDLFSGDE